MKLSEVASKVGAQLQNCVEDVDITGVARLEEAKTGQIAYVENPRLVAAARSTHASALIVPNEFTSVSVPTLRCDYPFLILTRILELFYKRPEHDLGIHPTAVIHASAKIGDRASIGAYVVIEREVEIGNDAVLLPHVVIYRGACIGNNFFAHAHAVVREYCRLGDNVVLQNGAVIGADGFGFVREEKNGHSTWENSPHIGHVVLEDGVEIQTNASVQRALVGETRIGRHVKVGDLAVVGHGTTVGECSMLSPQIGIAGEARVGKHVTLLGQVGVIPYCRIGDGATVTGKSAVVRDVDTDHVVSGSPAMDNRQWLRAVALFKRLPELARQLHLSVGTIRDGIAMTPPANAD